MARLIPNDYQPTDTSKLNWDEAPPAPAQYRCAYNFDKSYGGLVWAPEIRDFLFDKFGVFGTFQTPALLDEAGCQKLCYLISGDGDLRDYADGKYDRQSLVTITRPKNYTPFKYYDKPREWVKNQFYKRRGMEPITSTEKEEDFFRKMHHANSKRPHQNDELLEDDLFIDDAEHVVRTNDRVRLVNSSKKKVTGTIGTVFYQDPRYDPSMVRVYLQSNCGDIVMDISIHNLRKFIPNGTDIALVPPKSPKHVMDWSKIPPERKRKRQAEEEEADKKIGLCGLSMDLKQHIASFLPLLDVELHLRHACRDTFWNFKKPPPDDLEYDFVYFTVYIVRGGVGRVRELGKQWHGVAHTTDDVSVAIRNHDWEMEEIVITLKFVKFDRNQAIVPLFKCQWSYPSYQTARLDPLGCHYCGVRYASHVGLDESFISLNRRENLEQTKGKAHFAVFRHCRDWTPREPRIQLRHIGVRLKECGECGQGISLCRCGFRIWPDLDDYFPGYYSRIKPDTEFHLYYNPEWFENSNDFAFSAPTDSRDKTVILFSDSRGPIRRSKPGAMDDYYEMNYALRRIGVR